ncbi:MAG: endonuclease/exonuclease/phosphatase family protein [Salinibacter sp.]
MSSLRLMTYNLRASVADAEDPPWPVRRGAVASMIRFHGPDIVGVQEALPSMLDDLDAHLEAFTWLGRGRGSDQNEHCALFYRPDRLTLERHDTFWLSTSPGVPESRSWGAAYPRVSTWAAVADDRTDRSLVVLNTHFDHDSARARRESAQLLGRQIDALAGPAAAVVLGDLNSPPGAPPYRHLVGPDGSALRDALYESAQPHHGPVATFNGFGAGVQPGARIDYIFVRGPVDVRRHGTLTDRWNGSFPSDHCPVAADVLLRSDPSAP